jgi:hypothetical protein
MNLESEIWLGLRFCRIVRPSGYLAQRSQSGLVAATKTSTPAKQTSSLFFPWRHEQHQKKSSRAAKKLGISSTERQGRNQCGTAVSAVGTGGTPMPLNENLCKPQTF